MSIIKNIALLGSTGSIGTQTLDVCRMHGIRPIALCAAKNTELLEKQAREFMSEAVCIYDENRYSDMKQRLSDTDIKVLCGMDGLCEVSSLKTDAVVNSVVGMVGLRPTLAALDAGNKVALANKETLVTGGELVMKKAKEKNLPILTASIPLYSSRLWQAEEAVSSVYCLRHRAVRFSDTAMKS